MAERRLMSIMVRYAVCCEVGCKPANACLQQESYGDATRMALSRWTTKEPLPDDVYLLRDGKLKESRA